MPITDELKQAILEQIDDALDKYNEYLPHRRGSSSDKEHEIITILTSTIERLTPSNSLIRRQLQSIFTDQSTFGSRVPQKLQGMLNALRYEYEMGYIDSFEELLLADIFADFLEMAEHLLENGYKDASAVIVGSVLEQHLRKLAIKNDIDVKFENKKGELEPKKASRLNDDLKKEEIYTKLEHKQVTTWLNIRNDAAHGNYDAYEKENVSLMLQGVTFFIQKFPA